MFRSAQLDTIALLTLALSPTVSNKEKRLLSSVNGRGWYKNSSIKSDASLGYTSLCWLESELFYATVACLTFTILHVM